MSIARVKKNDIVAVAAGVEAGKTGKVLQIAPGAGRAFVEGLNLVKKAIRKSQENPQGGIVDKEASIAMSCLLLPSTRLCLTCLLDR